VCAASGVKRSVSEMKKKWSQIKSATKEKAVLLRKDLGMTGGGPKMESDLSEQECRVVGVMGDLCIKGIVPGLDTCDSVMETASGMVH